MANHYLAVHLGLPKENDIIFQTSSGGNSFTNKPTSWMDGTSSFRVVDTPGLLDTNGILQDESNIVHYVAGIEYVNGFYLVDGLWPEELDAQNDPDESSGIILEWTLQIEIRPWINSSIGLVLGSLLTPGVLLLGSMNYESLHAKKRRSEKQLKPKQFMRAQLFVMFQNVKPPSTIFALCQS
ncbi:hypothetical protein EMCRGX_G017877 [Ephydatia muelleri]